MGLYFLRLGLKSFLNVVENKHSLDLCVLYLIKLGGSRHTARNIGVACVSIERSLIRWRAHILEHTNEKALKTF